ncbi:hypothetical protein HHL17_24385 [Chitinophaga sp. G-6-1-13]|uniref:Thiol-activated cytolysin n=1 Tax=Chitinophaga fulva TaxID=2728842 RepID=A0A848GXH9_9BACT|nr:hypothetical protein [Chitinophaga fulva]NML40358.1 hypothetical protein [Chitinophaga fulva]
MILKNTVVALSVAMIVISCGKKETPNRPPDPTPTTPETPTNPVASGTAKKARMDSLTNVIKKWQLNNIVRDSVWQDSAGVSFFIRYTAGWYRYNDNNLFPGNTINPVKFKNSNELEFVTGPENQQVKIFNSNHVVKPFDTLVTASKAAVDGTIRYWFRENKGTVSGAGSGKAVRFTDYATLFLSFPGTLTNRFFDPVPVSQLIPVAQHASLDKKIGCMVYSVASYYTVYFDYLDGLQRYKDYYATNTVNKGFISSVSYGHEVYVFVESDATEDKLIAAINRTLDGTATGEDIELLRQSHSRVYYRHTAADKVAKENLNGYDRLNEFVRITRNTPFQYTGVPVYYGVTNATPEDIEADRILKVDYKL